MIMLDRMRYAQYTGMPEIVAPVAHGLGITLSDEAILNQQLAAASVALIDDTLEKGSPDEREAIMTYWEHLALGSPMTARPEGVILPQLMADMRCLHERITPQQARTFFELGQSAIQLSNEYAKPMNVKDYYSKREQEARLALTMMATVTPQDEKKQSGFARYVKLLATVGAIGTSYDSITDLSRDVAKGRTAIPNTLASRIELLKLAIAETRKGIGELGWPTTIGICLAGLKHSLLIKKLRYVRGLPPARLSLWLIASFGSAVTGFNKRPNNFGHLRQALTDKK